MKKLVRWTAVYETVIDVPEGDDPRDYACHIPVDVPGSEYQAGTWDVESITDYVEKKYLVMM